MAFEGHSAEALSHMFNCATADREGSVATDARCAASWALAVVRMGWYLGREVLSG